MNKTVIDLFAGAGGFSAGFKKAGFKIVKAVEFDKQIASTYKKNHPDTELFVEDIKDIAENKTLSETNAEIIIGGPPCQGFSMAGARIRNSSADDPRNYLFKYYCEIVKQVKPKLFIFENVKGILTAEKGLIFKEIINAFSDKGNFNGDKYFVYYKVFNAVDFGIPQKRERVFIIGSLNKAIDVEKYLKIAKNGMKQKYPYFFDTPTIWNAISNLKNEDKNGSIVNIDPKNNYQLFLGSETSTTYNHIKPKHNLIAKKRMVQIKEGENWTVLSDNIKSIHSGSYGRLEKDGVAPTITTRFDTPSGGCFIHPFEDRTLSPREGARLQSFPDSFEFLGNKTSIYKQVGNAVPPKLAFFFAYVISAILKEEYFEQAAIH